MTITCGSGYVLFPSQRKECMVQVGVAVDNCLLNLLLYLHMVHSKNTSASRQCTHHHQVWNEHEKNGAPARGLWPLHAMIHPDDSPLLFYCLEAFTSLEVTGYEKFYFCISREGLVTADLFIAAATAAGSRLPSLLFSARFSLLTGQLTIKAIGALKKS